LINTWANYHFDVGLEDIFRIRLAKEGECLDENGSSVKDIRTYYLPKHKFSAPLLLVDVPGFIEEENQVKVSV